MRCRGILAVLLIIVLRVNKLIGQIYPKKIMDLCTSGSTPISVYCKYKTKNIIVEYH